MIVAKMESNMESSQVARTFSACHELVRRKRGNIFLQIYWEMLTCCISACFFKKNFYKTHVLC